jgi:ornithine cyclodeaminase
MSNFKQTRAIVRQTYIDHQDGKTVNPHSVFLRFNESPNRIIALPAYIATAMTAGVKWISSFPGNIDVGMPRASAVIILNDVATGFPVACLEGTVISSVRTAMSAVICLEELSDGRRLAALSIVGAGEIASTTCRILAADNWVIDEVFVHDVRPHRAKSLSLLISRLFPGVRVTTDLGLSLTIANGEAILFATTASSPYVSDVSLFDRNPIVLHVSLRDLDPIVLRRSQNIVDDADHVLRAQTSLDNARRQGVEQAVIAGSIGDLILRRLRRDPSRPAIVSPFGLGMLDIALGAFAYDMAIAAGAIMEVPSFFPAPAES